jgi:hypothetical protein
VVRCCRDCDAFGVRAYVLHPLWSNSRPVTDSNQTWTLSHYPVAVVEPFAAIACVHQDKFVPDVGLIRSRDSIKLRPDSFDSFRACAHDDEIDLACSCIYFRQQSQGALLRDEHRIQLPSALILGILVSTSLCWCVLPLPATTSSIKGKAACCAQATSMKHWL